MIERKIVPERSNSMKRSAITSLSRTWKGPLTPYVCSELLKGSILLFVDWNDNI